MCPKVCRFLGHIKISSYMDLKSKIGLRIKQLRRDKKLSQQKFSYVADIERTFLTHIEKGRKNITIGTLEKIFNALEISCKDFFDSNEFAKP